MSEWMNKWINQWMTEWLNDWINEWMNAADGAELQLSSGGRQVASGSVSQHQQNDAELRSLPQERLHQRLQWLHTRSQRVSTTHFALLSSLHYVDAEPVFVPFSLRGGLWGLQQIWLTIL